MATADIALELDNIDREQQNEHLSDHGGQAARPELSAFWRNADTDLESTRVTIRDKVRDFLKTRTLGKTIMVVNVFFSLSACALYVAATYASEDNQDALYLALPENFFNGWFLIDYVFYIWLAEDRLNHITSGPTICDLLSLLPALNYVFGSDLGFFRFLRVFRAFRVLRAHRVLSFYAPGAIRQVARLFLIIFSVLFVAAGFCHALEQIADEFDYEECPGGGTDNCDQPFSQANMDFHEALYFVIITFSTVGYGDIYPTHNYSRMIIALWIPCAIVIIPVAGTTIFNILAAQSDYEKPYKHHEGWTHIVICGTFEVQQLRRFLKEWYHKDMGKSNRKRVVLLKPEEPPGLAVVNRILEHPFLETRVSWCRGSVFRRQCMEWVRGLPEQKHQAEAFIVLTNTYAEDKVEEDSRAIQRAVAIRRQNSGMRIIVQLLLHESKHRLYQEDVEVYCVEEIKYGMFGRTSVVPGLSTLLSTIFQCREFVDFNTETLVSAKAQSLATVGAADLDDHQLELIHEIQDLDRPLKWREEWLLNSTRELAQMIIPPQCDGLTFDRFAQIVFSEFGHIVIAVELPANEEFPKARMIMNPFGLPFREGDSVVFMCQGRKAASDCYSAICDYFATHEIDQGDRPSMNSRSVSLGRLSVAKRQTRASLLFQQIEEDDSLVQQPLPAIIKNTPPVFWEEGSTEYDVQKVKDWGLRHIKHAAPQTMQDHIVYCGPLSSAGFFLQPLMRDQAHADTKGHVVYPEVVLIDSGAATKNLFDPEMIKTWERLTFYDKLTILQGNPVESHQGLPWCCPSTFTRAGVERASVFVMPHGGELSQAENLLGDEFVVRILRNLREHVMLHRHSVNVMRFKPMFIVELLHRHHIEYIRRPLPRPMAYAAGQVVNAQFMDVFPGKMFYSSAALPMLQHMISSWDSRPYVDVTDREMEFKHMESCHVILRDIPQQYHGKTFGSLFQAYIKRACLPIGFYRFHTDWDLSTEDFSRLEKVSMRDRSSSMAQAREEDADAAMMRNMRYVYANPRRKDLIHPKDKVYVLVNSFWYEEDMAMDPEGQSQDTSSRKLPNALDHTPHPIAPTLGTPKGSEVDITSSGGVSLASKYDPADAEEANQPLTAADNNRERGNSVLE